MFVGGNDNEGENGINKSLEEGMSVNTLEYLIQKT